MRAHQVFCIAGDVLQDLFQRPALMFLAAFSSLLYPMLMGMADGGISHLPAFSREGMNLRLSMVTALLGPAMAVMVIVTELLVPRKLKRELEPLLAAPVTDGEIVLGWSVVPAAVAALYVLLAFPLCELGFRVISRAPLAHPRADLIAFSLSTAVSTVWILAGNLDALFKASSLAEFTFRMIPVWVVLLAIDGLRFLLRFAGTPRAGALVLLAGLALGLAALALVARRLERENLICRI